jgi:ATP-dependent Clp protease adapter protein ClpS
MTVTFSQDLEHALQRAAATGREQGREYATPEDLLIALTDDDDASCVLRASLIDFERLRRDIAAYMKGAVDEVIDAPSAIPKYTADLHRILLQAATQVQTSGRKVMTGADILVELFNAPVGHLLQQQGTTRYDAVNYLSHGVARDARLTRPGAMSGVATPQGDAACNAGDSPSLEVVLLNDEYTPMEFVVWVLEEVFSMSHQDATRIMLSAHNDGLGSCGVFSRADAAELPQRAENLARTHQHPLRCVMRPAPGPSDAPDGSEARRRSTGRPSGE